MLDKNPQICTVVNKVLHPAGRARPNNWAMYRTAWLPQLTRVANEYRTCETELLAGDPCLETVVKESGATFGLDYGTVRSVAPVRSIVGSATHSCAKSSGRFDIGRRPCQREHARSE